MNNKKSLYIISFIATMIVSFIPGVGIIIDGDWNHYHFGYPAEWLGYYGGLQFSFNVFGVLFNFFVFYFLFSLLNKILKKMRTKPGDESL